MVPNTTYLICQPPFSRLFSFLNILFPTNMRDIKLDTSLLSHLAGKTAILTGGAGGIGSTIAKQLLENGANVVIADLENTRPMVETMLMDLPDSCSGQLHFVATNIVIWDQMTALFQSAKEKFGSIHLVIANAGVMENEPVLDMDQIDERGNLKESEDFSKVIDINVKGTMNCLRQAMFSMRGNEPCYADGSRGAVVLVSSISGYFGGTGVSGYITSKHAVTGMLRGSQLAARKYGIRVNAVAPFVTPTAMAGGFSEAWRARGLPINTTDGVARALLTLAFNPSENGSCYVVWNGVEVHAVSSLILTDNTDFRSHSSRGGTYSETLTGGMAWRGFGTRIRGF